VEALSLQPPESLSETHQTEGFSCCVEALDAWLFRRALSNQRSGASRTYVVAARGRVAGYYCLASGALALREAPGGIRRNMPDPIPMAILGRLAVDQSWQGKSIGVALLRDAVERTWAASDIIGIRGLLVHALPPVAASFYVRYGFTPSPTNPLTLVMSLKQTPT
jgi:GNAT superfamily N-acetyltransferase